MTTEEKDAIIQHLDKQLNLVVQKAEGHVPTSVLFDLYEGVYMTLVDLEQVMHLQTQISKNQLKNKIN